MNEVTQETTFTYIYSPKVAKSYQIEAGKLVKKPADTLKTGSFECSGQPKQDSKLGFSSATAGGNPPFAVCGLRQL